MMERRVKERLIGATLLVVLIVLVVPEMLSGPRRPSAPPLTAGLPAPTRSVSVDLATSKAIAESDLSEGASAARGTLIGAIASGLPVVTSSGPITDKFLLNSEAMLFSDGSPQSIRSAIELLFENPALARDLGARGQRLYRESFQPAVIVARIREAMVCSKEKELVNEEAVLHG